MKKLFKGYNGKTGAKVIVIGAAAAVTSVAILCGNIVSNLNNRPQVDNPYDDTYISDTTSSPEYGANTDNLVTEPPIETDSVYETGSETETTIPELEETLIPEQKPDIPVEDMSADFVDVLAKLTNNAKDYFYSVQGTTPNLTIVGLNSMNINSEKHEVQLLGQVKINNTYNYFVATIKNYSDIKIFNLPKNNISEKELINALDEILSDNTTECAWVLNQYIQLSNQTEIIDEMLETRLEDLKSANDTADKTEIAHLNKVIKNTSKLELSVILDDRVKTDAGHNYSFKLAVNTGKYLYVLEDSVISKRLLDSTALGHAIEDLIDGLSEFDVNSIPSTPINEVVYIINDTAFNFNNNKQTLGQ